jgi:hypothetical protein
MVRLLWDEPAVASVEGGSDAAAAWTESALAAITRQEPLFWISNVLHKQQPP